MEKWIEMKSFCLQCPEQPGRPCMLKSQTKMAFELQVEAEPMTDLEDQTWQEAVASVPILLEIQQHRMLMGCWHWWVRFFVCWTCWGMLVWCGVAVFGFLVLQSWLVGVRSWFLFGVVKSTREWMVGTPKISGVQRGSPLSQVMEMLHFCVWGICTPTGWGAEQMHTMNLACFGVQHSGHHV